MGGQINHSLASQRHLVRWRLYPIPGWPTAFAPDAVALAVGFSVLVGIFFGFYPARRAARLDPIGALHPDGLPAVPSLFAGDWGSS